MGQALTTTVEERVLAGRLAGALWLSAAPMLCVGLLIPGVEASRPLVVLTLAAVAGAWGLLCLFAIDWERTGTALIFHLPAMVSAGLVAAAVAATGGADSPLWLILVMLIAYCGYFYTPRQAVLYTAGCLAVFALPFAYDPRAVEAGLLGGLWVALPAFAGVAGVVILGKRQLVELRDAAQELSLTDSLSGLANRRALTECLSERLAGHREADRVALLLVDLDDFKDANTLYGYPGGDAALSAVAGALVSVTREGDFVARLGGDEFAIVAAGLGERGLDRLAGRVLGAVREAGAGLDLPGFALSASVGWARCPEDAKTVDDLVAVADLSLRGAKACGKDTSLSPLHWQPDPAAA